MIWGLRFVGLFGIAIGLGWVFPGEWALSPIVGGVLAIAIAQGLALSLGWRRRQLATAKQAYEDRMRTALD